eukprot:9175626-Alexandrium_andersonii.AAC.1
MPSCCCPTEIVNHRGVRAKKDSNPDDLAMWWQNTAQMRARMGTKDGDWATLAARFRIPLHSPR